MTDVVYVNKDGENPELRYSLRTLQNVAHGEVWVFGGAPSWLNPGTVNSVQRSQRGSPYRSTRSHIETACNTQGVSDPFFLWNDDFFAMRPTDIKVLHRGSLVDLVSRTPRMRTPWWKGLYETTELIQTWSKPDHVDWKSYDLHVPMVVFKDVMREALQLAEKVRTDAVHLRTIYGNLQFGGAGVTYVDPKVLRRNDPFPRGPWMSSSPDTFRSTVEPVLRYLFPDPSIYEKG